MAPTRAATSRWSHPPRGWRSVSGSRPRPTCAHTCTSTCRPSRAVTARRSIRQRSPPAPSSGWWALLRILRRASHRRGVSPCPARRRRGWMWRGGSVAKRKAGIVYLVGAGPGDPELITVKGLACLRRADVVLYDRLVARELLDEAPRHAERIDVGKEPQRHRRSQTEINALLVAKASVGNIVVRLKGGDPFIFGRGGEECQALSDAGIAYEV